MSYLLKEFFAHTLVEKFSDDDLSSLPKPGLASIKGVFKDDPKESGDWTPGSQEAEEDAELRRRLAAGNFSNEKFKEIKTKLRKAQDGLLDKEDLEKLHAEIDPILDKPAKSNKPKGSRGLEVTEFKEEDPEAWKQLVQDSKHYSAKYGAKVRSIVPNPLECRFILIHPEKKQEDPDIAGIEPGVPELKPFEMPRKQYKSSSKSAEDDVGADINKQKSLTGKGDASFWKKGMAGPATKGPEEPKISRAASWDPHTGQYVDKASQEEPKADHSYKASPGPGKREWECRPVTEISGTNQNAIDGGYASLWYIQEDDGSYGWNLSRDIPKNKLADLIAGRADGRVAPSGPRGPKVPGQSGGSSGMSG